MANILIVDDSAVVKYRLRQILERYGHVVVGEASDGIQAIIMYKGLNPDIVTMDINMPGKNGIETTIEILKDDPGAKIIMITSEACGENVIKALQSGARNYILKPFNIDRVIQTIDDVCKGNSVKGC